MMIKCPNCGTHGDLALFLAADDTAQAIATALQYCEIGAELIQYISLFTPIKSGKLSMKRVKTLLEELLPDFKSQRIVRDGIVIEAPPAAWRYAINQMLANPSLMLPLKSHGYLYEIIKSYRHSNECRQVVLESKQLDAIDADEARRQRMKKMGV